MRKRVGTKLYDTDTAKFMCHTPDGDLYRKHNGGFYFWNENPHDVAYSEAKKYLDLLGIELEHDLETSISKKHCTVKISESDLYTISENAEILGMSNRAFVMLCVEEYLKNHEK